MAFIVLGLKNFLKSVRSVLSTESFDSLYERNLSNVQTRKTQLTLNSFPNESDSVSCNSWHYRGAKMVNCPSKTSLGKVDFATRISRKLLKHTQHVIVKDQVSNIKFQ